MLNSYANTWTRDEEDGVPHRPPQTSEGFTGYVLIYDGVVLQDGQKFSDYAIPHSATINVVLKHYYYETADEFAKRLQAME